MADTADLKSAAEKHEGSNPSAPTKKGLIMSYNQLRSRYAHDLEVMLDEGEITEDEAMQMMEDWEYGYGDQMYDCWRDKQIDDALEERWNS